MSQSDLYQPSCGGGGGGGSSDKLLCSTKMTLLKVKCNQLENWKGSITKEAGRGVGVMVNDA